MRYYWPIHYFLKLQENLSEHGSVLLCLMKDGPSVPEGWGRGKISSRKLADELFAKVGDSPQKYCCEIAAIRHHHLPRPAGGGWIYPPGGHRRPILCGRWHDSGPNRIPWKNNFGVCRPIFQVCSGHRNVIISHLPSFLTVGCCEDNQHVPNWLFGEFGSWIASEKFSTVSALHTSRLTQWRVLHPLWLLAGSNKFLEDEILRLK
jgi:hypothetical protein